MFYIEKTVQLLNMFMVEKYGLKMGNSIEKMDQLQSLFITIKSGGQKGEIFGINNDYTNESWKRFVKILHREDGPAIESADGSKYLNKNVEFHREDGPAIEWAGGSREWWFKGKLHREDGPAIEYPNGDKSWYLNDKKYGRNDDFTNESWSKFIKTLLFS